MSSYEFLTVWEFDAPVAGVWEIIENADAWPEWWRGVVSNVEITKGDDDGLGSVRRSRWKSALPYTLTFDSEIVRVEKFRLIEARAFGELNGTGLWQFEQIQDSRTRVTYDWRVSTAKAWMNAIAPIARPFFKWNHDVIMRWGEEGLRKRLGEKL